jgi:hypothetical protein
MLTLLGPLVLSCGLSYVDAPPVNAEVTRPPVKRAVNWKQLLEGAVRRAEQAERQADRMKAAADKALADADFE